jgi:hypothetical protein
MTQLEKFQNMVEPYKDTLVIGDLGRVVRLVGVEDGGDDYYWIYDSPQGIYRATCVGEWIPLKGKIDPHQYGRMVGVWNGNMIVPAH